MFWIISHNKTNTQHTPINKWASYTNLKIVQVGFIFVIIAADIWNKLKLMSKNEQLLNYSFCHSSHVLLQLVRATTDLKINQHIRRHTHTIQINNRFGFITTFECIACYHTHATGWENFINLLIFQLTVKTAADSQRK